MRCAEKTQAHILKYDLKQHRKQLKYKVDKQYNMRIRSVMIIKNIIVKLGNISALRCFEMHNFPPLFSYFAHYPQVKGESVSHWVVSDSLQLHGYSPPGSSVHGVLQARILEWLAISLSKGSSWLGDRTWGSCIVGRFFTVWAIREASTVLDVNYLLVKLRGKKLKM